jgi:LysM repeat protein
MIVTGEDPKPPRPADAVEPSSIARRRVASAVLEVCPYLRTEAGSWRSAYAAREHQCGAVEPAAQLTIAKQRSLCLLPAHAACATFVAAGDGTAEAPADAPGRDAAALWPATRSTPLLLEPVRGLLAPLTTATPRTGGQAMLVGLMVLAFVVLAIARTSTPDASGGSTPGASASLQAAVASSSAGVSASATPRPTPSPSATTTPSPSPTSPPTASPTTAPTATPSSTRRYTVKAGDTLSGIAARFNTTVKALAAANNIVDPRLIRIGQVLVIP